MEKRLGLISGSGDFPLFLYREARSLGFECVIAGIRGAADPALGSQPAAFQWFDVGDITALISFLKSHGVEEAVFAGKIDHRIVFQEERLERNNLDRMIPLVDRSPTTLIQAVIRILGEHGIRIIDSTPFLTPAFCPAGILTRSRPSRKQRADMDYGWRIARHLADLDVGQSVVVKNRTTIALEGLEGTDAAVERGGQLAGMGVILVKVARTQQDARIDLPAVGLKTVESLVKVQGAGLCFEAERMPFFQREEAVALADAHKLTIVARTDRTKNADSPGDASKDIGR